MWFLVTTSGQRLAIRGLPAVVGSDPGADVVIPHASIRPRHARLTAASATALEVEALEGSEMGVEGLTVEWATLRDGDDLTLGELQFVVRREAEQKHRPAAPPAAPTQTVGARSGLWRRAPHAPDVRDESSAGPRNGTPFSRGSRPSER